MRETAGRGTTGPELRGGEDRPGVRRDHVTPGGDVRAVHVQNRVRSVVQRSGTPEAAIAVSQLSGLRPLELRRVAAVENDRLPARKELVDQLHWRVHADIIATPVALRATLR